MNPLDLTGKTVMVTGASNGIGRATSVYLSRMGARIIAVGRNHVRLDETLAALEGSQHRSYALDLAEVESLPTWMKAVAAEVGALYGLVHSAGMVLHRPLRVQTYPDYAAIMRINLDAAVMLSKGFRQKGVRDESGSAIVYLTSLSAIRAQPALAAYSASKAGLISLARTLGRELASDRVRVNCVCPALVQTDMAVGLSEVVPEEQYKVLVDLHPLGIGTPEDVAYAIAFLLAPAAKWITGTTLVIDGGFSA